MAVPLEQFVKQLENSGILTGDTLREFIPPKASPENAEELARELVRQKKLTKFQAEEVYRGKGKTLTLGNYVLMDKIGQGGMGAVYKAEHRRMKRVVALKMLPPGMMKNAEAAARFQREVEAAARLRHPNIVAADDADEANGVHFLVMEYVEGSDLSALVKKNGPLPVAQAVNCVLQAARGLEAAHAEGIVHRDIKPANLLLDKKGTVKILDMGLARIEGNTAGQAELTGTGAVMGTVDYMAPEQALNTKTADARADVYSLGCTLYYLLTAKATYGGDSLMAKLLAHRDEPIPPLRAVRPEVPEQVAAIFTRMVAKKVADRYQSMTAVIADLERCVSGSGSAAAASAMTTTTDAGLTDFLQGISVAPAAESAAKKPAAVKVPVKLPKPYVIGGAAVGGVALLAVLGLLFGSRGAKPPEKTGQQASVAALNGAKPAGPGARKAPVEESVADPERRAALWVLGQGGTLDIEGLGKGTVRGVSDLPAGAFKVARINLNRKIQDDELGVLDGLTALNHLDLSRSGITDAGLEHVEDLTQLNTLRLEATEVTDAGLARLDEMKLLRMLRLANTGVTLAGVTALQRALPDCRIEWPAGKQIFQPGPVAGGSAAEADELDSDEWHGLGEYWKLNSQELTGSTGKEKLGFNTFFCGDNLYRDFELTCDVRLTKGNTGIQIRSEFADRQKFVLQGPQVDIGPKYWGCLYGEKTNGMMQAAPAGFEESAVKANDFNAVRVRCVGKHVLIQINGQTSVDREFPELADSGLIGIQLHAGDTGVIVRNWRLREIEAGAGELQGD